jgi:hypothetical protein
MSESVIGMIGELVAAGDDLIDGVKDCWDPGKSLDVTCIFTKIGALSTFANKIKWLNSAGMGGIAPLASFGALLVDLNKIEHAVKIKNKEVRTDEIIITSLSIVSDIAGIVSVIPDPQIKLYAIGINETAIFIKDAYVNRKEIAQFFRGLSNDMSSLSKRLKNDPSIYLNLPNSAIRCHVVNGLNMNRGLVYHGAFSQNRLQPHSWRTADNQHRTPTQRTLTADEMRIQQRLDRVVRYMQEHPGVHPEFEWKKPGVFELSTYPKR